MTPTQMICTWMRNHPDDVNDILTMSGYDRYKEIFSSLETQTMKDSINTCLRTSVYGSAKIWLQRKCVVGGDTFLSTLLESIQQGVDYYVIADEILDIKCKEVKA